MAPPPFDCPLLILTGFLLIIQGSTAVTIVSDGIPFVDDFNYSDTAYSSLNEWYNPGSGLLSNLSGPDDLGSVVTPCNASWCGSEGRIHGWWNRWGQSSVEEDPARTMQREFECDSKSTVTLSLSVYFCITVAGSKSTFYAKRWIHGASTTLNVVEYDLTEWEVVSTENVADCISSIRSKAMVDIFEVDRGQTVSVTVSQTLEGSPWRSTLNWAAFNRFVFRCDQIETVLPSMAPSGSTMMPSISPSMEPTLSTSSLPTLEPTLNPTEVITTSTAMQTLTPSNNPSADPSMEPTLTPTVRVTAEPTVHSVSTSMSSTNSFRSSSSTINTEVVDERNDNIFGAVFGADSDCENGWSRCHFEVCILSIGVTVLCLMCCVIAFVIRRKRQHQKYKMKRVPVSLREQEEHRVIAVNDDEARVSQRDGMAMTQHITANRWKSEWELEQEQELRMLSASRD